MRRKIFVIGDPQVGLHTQENRAVRKIRDITPAQNDIVIFPGDLTHHGVGNVHNPFIKYLNMCACLRAPTEIPDTDELQIFRDEIAAPVEKRCKNVLYCIGNHDTLVRWWWQFNPVEGFVRQKHGKLTYAYNVDDEFLIYCLSEYPTDRALKWLKKRLRKDNKPAIIFFHFNLEGPFSDFWGPDQKKKFDETLSQAYDGQIAFVVVGHHHYSYAPKTVELPSGRKIQTVNGSGEEAACVDVEIENGEWREVKFSLV